MTDHYAVIGNPVEHSKSPFIHARFAEQSGQDMDYGRIRCEIDRFEVTVRDFFKQGGKGLNVTVPFKQEAFALAESRSPEAALAGAVNTLALDASGGIYGHNTDGIGLVRDICVNLGATLAGKRILVLGAGGATRGILQPLLEQGPARILVANRTAKKAAELATLFSGLGEIAGAGFDAIPAEPWDWVINASAASLEGEVPPLPPEAVGERSCCYDLMYGSEPTVFCRWASERGALVVADGLGMLVEQAAESFLLWRGLRPETLGLMSVLRSSTR